MAWSKVTSISTSNAPIGIPATFSFTFAAISFSDAFKHGVKVIPFYVLMHVASVFGLSSVNRKLFLF